MIYTIITITEVRDPAKFMKVMRDSFPNAKLCVIADSVNKLPYTMPLMPPHYANELMGNLSDFGSVSGEEKDITNPQLLRSLLKRYPQYNENPSTVIDGLTNS